MKLALILNICFFALLMGCARKAENTATVLIQWPSAQKLSTSSVATFSDDNPDDDDLEWSSAVPDGLSSDSTALTPINCYAVMVEGPEPLMRAHLCGRRDPISKTINTNLYHFRVGQWLGAIPGNASSAPAVIPFEVPAGLARTFRLIGFHVDNLVDCITLQGDPDLSKLSRPYVIAESNPIDLAPGDKDVVLPMTFDANKWFDTCNFGGGGGGSREPVIATQIRLSKDSFPRNKWTRSSTTNLCQAIDIQLIDNLGRPAVFPPGLTQINYSLLSSSAGNNLNLPTFASKADCLSPMNPGVTIFPVVTSALELNRRWLRIPMGTGLIGPLPYFLQEVSRVPATITHNITPQSLLMTTIDENESYYFFYGPKVGLKGETYEVDLIRRRFNGLIFPDWTSIGFNFVNSLLSPFFFQLFDSNNCSTPGLSVISSNFANPSLGADETFCLRFSGVGSQIIDVGVGGSPYPEVNRFESRGGSDVPQRIGVDGPNQFSRPATGESCVGPVQLILENEFAAAVKNKDPVQNVQISYNYTSDSPVNDTGAVSAVELHFTKTINASFAMECPSSALRWPAQTIQNVGFNEYRIPIYLKIPQMAPLGWRRLELKGTINGRTIRGTYRFSIDEAD